MPTKTVRTKHAQGAVHLILLHSLQCNYKLTLSLIGRCQKVLRHQSAFRSLSLGAITLWLVIVLQLRRRQLVGRVVACFWFASIARSSARLIFGGGTGISPNRNSLPGRLLSPSSSFCYSVRLISLGAGTFLISSLIASVAVRTSWISLTRICINHAQMEIWSCRWVPSKNDFCHLSHTHAEVWHHNFLWRTLLKIQSFTTRSCDL